MTQKEKNDEQIKHLKDQCFNLGENADGMRQNVKAAKRQNKLLGVALTKAQTHKGELEMLSEKIEMQKSVINKNMVQMPDLVYSPFLPLE